MAMVDDWLTHRANGDRVLMLATERASVDKLNRLARAHLRYRGEVSKHASTYMAPDGSRTITLAVGDEIILRRNVVRLPQPHGEAISVRNGMTGRITRSDKRGVAMRLDAEHRTVDGQADVALPAAYVGEHVGYGYARTVDTAQGTTVDHSLFAPSTSTSAERAYVALSRGRHTNRIYATRDRRWIDAICSPRTHTLATDQHPDLASAGDLDNDLSGHRSAPSLCDRDGRHTRRQPQHWPVHGVREHQALWPPQGDDPRPDEPERNLSLGL
jgi:hypothetical protein